MIALRPRQFVNRGSVQASGFKLDLPLMGIAQARRRVLRLWQPGLRLLASPAGDAYFVLLPAPLRIDAAQSPGEPLVRQGRLLIALPLAGKELEALDAFADTVVFARGGRVESIRVSDLKEEDASAWIATASAALAEVRSLGAPPAPIVFAEQKEYDARRDLPGVPDASIELQEMLRELQGKRTADDKQKSGAARSSLSALARNTFEKLKSLFSRQAANLAAGARYAAGRALEKLGRLFGPRAGSAPTASILRPAPTAPPPPPGSLAQWMNRTAARLLNLSRLSRFLANRQARYMIRMLEMLESGDLQEGLRHAIPLAGAQAMAKKIAFGVPQPRTALTINPYRPGASASLGFGPDFYERLRQTYRQTFQTLEAQGKIEEAAFVLTELLGAHPEAVNFLEKHGRLRMAAQVAEGRGMPPATAIRLWWLAGDHQRALMLARRTGEFEPAIRLLEATHPQEADKLRVLWAERLAGAGNYLHAADAILPVPSGSTLAFTWFGQAAELGGAAAATALARMAVYFPGSFDRVLPRATALMDDESRERARERQTFAEELQKSCAPQFKTLRERLHRTAMTWRETCAEELRDSEFQQAEVKARQQVELLARVAARALVRDLQNETLLLDSKKLKELIEFTGDASLNADVPAAGALKHRRPQPHPGVPEIAAHDIGRTPLTDAALLPGGRMLLALGEAGMQLLARDGRVIAHFDQPAHQLVLSRDGNRAIAIAPRGEISRLARVDLGNRSAAWWCDAPITAHQRGFDGFIWYVASGADCFVIDTLAKNFEPLWRIPDMGRIFALQSNPERTRLWLVTDTPDRPNLGVMLWCYEQPSMRLRWKADLLLGIDIADIKGLTAKFDEDDPPASRLLRQTVKNAGPDLPVATQERPGQVLLITETGAILKESVLVQEGGPQGPSPAEHHIYLAAATSGKLDSFIGSGVARGAHRSELMQNALAGGSPEDTSAAEIEFSDLDIFYNLLRLPELFDRGDLAAAAAHGHTAALPVFNEGGVEVYVIDTTTGRHKLCLRLAGAKKISLRFTGETLVCADDQGRVLAIDTESNHLVRDLRV
jgi:hypothetical protein